MERGGGGRKETMSIGRKEQIRKKNNGRKEENDGSEVRLNKGRSGEMNGRRKKMEGRG